MNLCSRAGVAAAVIFLTLVLFVWAAPLLVRRPPSVFLVIASLLVPVVFCEPASGTFAASVLEPCAAGGWHHQ